MTDKTYPTRLVGNSAPEWKAEALVGSEFQTLSSRDYSGKWKVLFFYPLDFTFVCPTEITAFSDNIDKFQELDCELIACSIDSKFSHLAWSKQPRKEGGIANVAYPILADVTKEIARNFGVLVEDAGTALRGLFIIDKNDVVQHACINNLSVGRNVNETLRLVEAFQYTTEHGEVCPANWIKGKDSMKANPIDSKEYFNKNN